MKKAIGIALGIMMFSTGVVCAQEYPVADMVANKLIEKYQNSTCEQLWMQKMEGQGKPKPPREQEMLQVLQGNPAMRTYFLNKVAAPIVNKMFECGMIP